MSRFKGQSGMSLVEATIILLVLMLLTSVLAPSIYDYVNDAKDVKVKEDCEAIGTAIARLARDVNQCIKKFKADTVFTEPGCKKTDRADLLVSEGYVPVLAVGVDSSSTFGGNAVDIAWSAVPAGGNQADFLENHLVKNLVADSTSYPLPSQASFLNPLPGFARGWRGAYLAPPIGTDPWGFRYEVNSMFLAPANNTVDSTSDGFNGWNQDAFCISAGRNNTIETDFASTDNPLTGGVRRGGDDFIYVISGGSR